MLYTIKSIYGNTIFETEATSWADAIRQAREKGANLSSADLRNADLYGANLRGADLSGANLGDANLSSADLSSADLRGADLSSADLSSADLRGADLGDANLSSADLSSADLSYANLPAPTTLLLAGWGAVSDSLTADLMEFDALSHPDRKAFDGWAKAGPCPYSGVGVQRAANFYEKRELWGQGKVCGAYELMMRLFEEKGIKR